MNEQQLGNFVKRILDENLAVDDVTKSRLESARFAALARRPTTLESLSISSTVSVGLSPQWLLQTPKSFGFNVLLSIAVLLAGIITIHQWYEFQTANEIEEIDANVLTGELPLDAYLDKGFDTWLKRSSH